ncbi:unnamed protein product [Nippostrongylus brasiliensis]|uniref:G_PROTEIN_RECEP_F1_2 domain-containing protein n=1 Tax=Nippostrongylus brasiliensis TaxID=27835 RepID=A0A0N4Y8Q0_NIPBR|nr:unnamed protein product [Nippostrongylus brasiliensis]
MTPTRPPSHFPAFLALLDALLCFCFVLIFVVDVNMMYLELPGLFAFYHDYIILAFSTAKIVQFLIPYMLIMGTFERYTWIVNKDQCTTRSTSRPLSILLLLVAAVAVRAPAAAVLTVSRFPHCRDYFRTLAVDILPWAKTFLPFVTLIALNVVIIRRLLSLNSRLRKSSLAAMPGIRASILSSIRRYRMPPPIKHALYTMVAIVSTYLVSNSLHLLLTLLEFSNAENDSFAASTLYTTLGDLVSVLYMTSSAIRIFIYAKCNPTVWKQLSSNAFMNKFTKRKQSETFL